MKNSLSLSVTISLLLSSIFISSSTLADTASKPINTSVLPTVQSPEPLQVYWKERDGAILIDTVCFNYPEESKENKGCRKLAIKKFREECGKYEQLYHDSRPYYDDEYKKQMGKYCSAAADFIP